MPNYHSRVLLLISAIANNPGIKSGELLPAMQALAEELGEPCPDWSLATIRKDIRLLIRFRILESGGGHGGRGYRIGPGGAVTPPPDLRPKRPSPISNEEIAQLRGRGFSYQEIASQAGLSKQTVARRYARFSLQSPDTPGPGSEGRPESGPQ